MSDLYWYPFRNGTDGIPKSQKKLRSWLRRQYDDQAAIAALLFLMIRYGKVAYELGGQSALDDLGIDANFKLTNLDILKAIDERYRLMVAQDTEYSLIDTTVDDLAKSIPEAQDSGKTFLVALAAIIAALSANRTVKIERYERPFQVGQALENAYEQNGVRYIMYDVYGVGCPRICAPWHGQVFNVGTVRPVRIPQHSGCDCRWTAVSRNGQRAGFPEVIVALLGNQGDTLQPPANVWTGA
jgi:hypothetical protein